MLRGNTKLCGSQKFAHVHKTIKTINLNLGDHETLTLKLHKTFLLVAAMGCSIDKSKLGT